MIHNSDRSGWFGASDTSMVVGNWNTKTFKKWWLEKLGLAENTVNTKAMRLGTEYEHAILDCLYCKKDEQLKIENLRLRVNYDGTTNNIVYEVKTHKADKPFKVSKAYWRQAQVEMYCFEQVKGILPLHYFVAYPLGEKEYKNYFCDIDESKILMLKTEYDENFINNEYLPKLEYLADCLIKGTYPVWNQ